VPGALRRGSLVPCTPAESKLWSGFLRGRPRGRLGGLVGGQAEEGERVVGGKMLGSKPHCCWEPEGWDSYAVGDEKWFKEVASPESRAESWLTPLDEEAVCEESDVAPC
jgi:hypothetical protein